MSFEFVKELPTPAVVKEMYPVPKNVVEIKKERDQMIANVLLGNDDRFLVIVGPCSADREDAVCEYVSRLTALQEKVKERSREFIQTSPAQPETATKGSLPSQIRKKPRICLQG